MSLRLMRLQGDEEHCRYISDLLPRTRWWADYQSSNAPSRMRVYDVALSILIEQKCLILTSHSAKEQECALPVRAGSLLERIESLTKELPKIAFASLKINREQNLLEDGKKRYHLKSMECMLLTIFFATRKHHAVDLCERLKMTDPHALVVQISKLRHSLPSSVKMTSHKTKRGLCYQLERV